MTIRILVLTTEAPHHAHFVNRLIVAGHTVTVVSEETAPLAEATRNEFQHQQSVYERSLWFGDKVPSLNDLCPTRVVAGVNTLEGMETLRRSDADVAIAFGSSWIKTEALALLPVERWNLHGGDPQRYRGLDSHLWALYHGDSDALVTVLHTLDPDLDRGAVVAGRSVDLSRAPELPMLRAANTDLAVSLVLGSLAHLEAVGQVPQMPQGAIGRYYSVLPATLLEKCARQYANITGRERFER